MFASLVDIFIILGPVVTFVPQYQTLQTPSELKGFSKLTCLILLVAHLTRISYYFTNPFELSLLFQSIAMVVMQLLMIHKCVSLQAVDIIADRRRDLRDPLNFQDFWKWEDYLSYVKFVLAFGALNCLLAAFFSFIEFGGTLLGIVALGVESTLMIPQYLKNRNQRSTQGLSVLTVGLLSVGDILKLVYFMIKDIDVLFVICAVIQLCVDFLILGQV